MLQRACNSTRAWTKPFTEMTLVYELINIICINLLFFAEQVKNFYLLFSVH